MQKKRVGFGSIWNEGDGNPCRYSYALGKFCLLTTPSRGPAAPRRPPPSVVLRAGREGFRQPGRIIAQLAAEGGAPLFLRERGGPKKGER